MRYFCNLTAIAALCFITFSAQAKVTVALIAPMVGDYKQQGNELIAGVERAVEEINNRGGILKEKISLLKIDDQCSDSIAVSTAQMLTVLKDKKISLVIGPYCADAFEKVADIYANARIFQIIPTTVNYAQAKTIKKGLVKMLGYTNQEAKDFFSYYNANFAGDIVAVVSNLGNGESISEAQAIAEEFQKHGKTVVLKEYNYQMTDKNYIDLAERIFTDGAKMAFLLGSSANIRKMAYALRREKEDFVIFTNKYKAGEKYFDALGDYADGTYFMELKGSVDDPEFAETLVKLRLSGFEAEGLSLYGYSAVKLWQNLAQKAKSFDYDKLSAAINNKTVRTEFGSKMFHNGAPKVSESYAIYQYRNGGFEKVY
ncbi:MAG: ABC transporter substrate-binding protein [Alphaproteobacteria bacterium]|nr:ABC transporter substrate-binding protein [Alphaproteobacteria bacterium]